MKRKLPIGIQTFRKVREDGFYYVDKTPFIERLLGDGTHFFLSRPRRFGKSLFLDTLKELFEDSEALFEGLSIHGRWDWSARNPVVRLSFGSGHFATPDGLRLNVMAQLRHLERETSLQLTSPSAPERFMELIRALRVRDDERVVVLIDEYDKPILDALDTPGVAKANRDFLRGLYGVVKDCDADIRFSFITGVSKFSKVSLFSGLNNLTDVTIDPQYSSICGYTEADLETVFAPELNGLDRGEIREWYNGYCWLGTERVYNPFDILLLFRNRAFKPHWFETGTPAFLIETLFRRRVRSIDLDGMLASDELLSAFDVGAIAPEALLFQTGYLTSCGRSGAPGRPSTASAIRTGRCARDSTAACSATWWGMRPSAQCTAPGSTTCCWPTTSTACTTFSTPSTPAFPTSGTPTTTSPTTKASTPACSIRTLRAWGWT